MARVSTVTGLPYTWQHPLETERLVLRAMTLDDVDAVYAYQGREDVCRYLLYEPRTRDRVAEKVAEHAQAVQLAKDGDYLQLALELRPGQSEAGRMVGDAYFTIASVEHSRGEIGWAMHPDFTHRGLAAEAAEAVLEFAFMTLGLHRVFAELDPRNDASIALCRRLGMREEAFFRADMWFKGDWADTGHYALLAQEWAARRQVD